METETKQEEIKELKKESALNSKLIAQALIVGAVIIAGAILLKGTPPPQNTEKDVASSLSEVDFPVVTNEDHILGNQNASLVVVEYSDIECPFCKVFHQTMNRIISEKGEDIAWVYRHYPVAQLHQNAYIEAIATECAWLQGGNTMFWLYINKTFENTTSNDGLDTSTLPDIAQSLGLDKAKFTSCLENEEPKNKIEQSITDGNTLGTKIFDRGLGTPVSFIIKNGKLVDVIMGAQPYEMVTATLDKYLK
ncbi:MAG: DsbA family protein [Candidatus Pacebacteria bacterium]|nr:DsbA family protein [Candidatus Paceibacterota bacterium]MCF7862966.1 DsbA family protein [Candidatus Paceibacterota bacterium]